MSNQWSDPIWRLHNLYSIVNKDGKVVPFEPNWAQEQFLREYTSRTIVLKSRQIGFSTLIGLMQLDHCLFNPHQTAVCIAHDRDSLEKLFERNIRGPYERLPEGIRNAIPAKRDRTHQLNFANGSDASVTLSARSATVQFLHVSEFGKVCAKYPHKAKEIVTGAFPAVPDGGLILIESTAEGQAGYFYDYTQQALKAEEMGEEADWNLIFVPWHAQKEYRRTFQGVKIYPHMQNYFDRLRGKGIELDKTQMAWYVQKSNELGDEIKREMPSYPEEAFEQSIEGAYYANQMTKAREQGRICQVPHQSAALVNTSWDIGMADSTAIWFYQLIGRQRHYIDYYENSGEGLEHYAHILQEKAKEGNWLYGQHIGPHDLRQREIGSAQSILDTARGLGIDFDIAPSHRVQDRIEATRGGLVICWFDEIKCHEGIKALDAYRKEWDEARGTYKSRPLHDWASHAADSFGYGFMGPTPEHAGGVSVMPVNRTRIIT